MPPAPLYCQAKEGRKPAFLEETNRLEKLLARLVRTLFVWTCDHKPVDKVLPQVYKGIVIQATRAGSPDRLQSKYILTKT